MGVNGIRYMVSLCLEKVNDVCVLDVIAFWAERAGGAVVSCGGDLSLLLEPQMKRAASIVIKAALVCLRLDQFLKVMVAE